jgi:type VI secretion system protein ImpF
MTRFINDNLLLPSLLDRLTNVDGAAPGSAKWGQSSRDLKQRIRRDLENLLNTRWRCQSWPPNLDEYLELSLVGYGIPDFTSQNLGDMRERDEFRRVLEGVIRRF